MSGHTGARLLIEKLPASSTLIGDIELLLPILHRSGVAMPT